MKETELKNELSNALWRFIGLVVLGLISGIAVYVFGEKEDNGNILYLVFIFAVFTIVGFIIFLVKLIKIKKEMKKLKKQDE